MKDVVGVNTDINTEVKSIKKSYNPPKINIKSSRRFKTTYPRR